jgi:hypothetical protein
MSRTPTLPPTDNAMWRRLLARTHPDVGGAHELFIWTGSVRDHVCTEEVRSKPEPDPPRRSSYQSPSEDPARVPYPLGTDFREATKRALRRAASQPDGYGQLLALLEDCYPLDHLWREQDRGASYKRLAAIGHQVGMSKGERVGWYRVAESIPLSDRHAGHILSRLKERAA